LFKRTRTSYQVGSLTLEERKRGPAVWVYRWWEKGTDGTPIRRKQQIGTLERYPTESRARAASDTLRLTINDQSRRQSLPRSVRDLWEHYCCEELPRNEITTQDTYTVYAKTWILPRWGNMCLEQVKTVEVERWLQMVERADGTQGQNQNRHVGHFFACGEFCPYNPISSGIPVGTGGKRGPSVGVRVSAKQRQDPLVLSPEEVKLGLTEMQFRDQLLVFLIGALGIRRGEMGALR